jgi:hypothetical protein
MLGLHPTETWLFPRHELAPHATSVHDSKVRLSMIDQSAQMTSLENKVATLSEQMAALRLKFLSASLKTTFDQQLFC